MMVDTALQVPEDLERVIGEYSTGIPGPLLIVCGGVHGNEPAGVLAARRVLDELWRRRLNLRGKVVAVAGNIGALKQGRRFQERDLNRIWCEGALDDRDCEDGTRFREELERRELLQVFRRQLRAHRGPTAFLDLHSFSAGGSPFAIMGDTLRNRKLAFALPIPVILGLEETLQGTLLELFGEEGLSAIAVEGGQHQDPRTVECHVAAFWLTLVAVGCLERSQVSDHDEHFRFLEAAARGRPRVVEVTYRHAIAPEDRFLMNPGYENFQSVSTGEVLAADVRGPVTAPRSGYILMPLYQELGDDGFFVGGAVRMFWLRLSALLRHLRLEKLLIPLLPGVRRLPHRRNWVYVNPRIARWFVVEVFHLLGYRRQPARLGNHLFSRRPP